MDCFVIHLFEINAFTGRVFKLSKSPGYIGFTGIICQIFPVRTNIAAQAKLFLVFKFSITGSQRNTCLNNHIDFARSDIRFPITDSRKPKL